MWRWLEDRFFRRLKRTYDAWSEDDGSLLAASMAYYAAFSLFPLLLVLISVLGFTLRLSARAQDARQQLLALAERDISPVVARQLGTALDQVSNNAQFGGWVGGITLLLGAIGMFGQLEFAFNRIWRIPDREAKGILHMIHHALIDRLRAFLILVGVGLLLLASFVLGTAAAAIQRFVADLPFGDVGWNLLQIGLIASLNCLFLTVLFKVLPRAKVHWRDAAGGGLLAAALWEMVRQILTRFLIGSSYTAYGVIGSLMVLMFWIYVAANLLFFSAEFVHVLGQERANRNPGAAEK